MPIYIAMLRGINVSGQKIIKMERLRASVQTLGFTDVQTYVQSGNILFSAGKDSANRLARMLQGQIVHDFGFSVPVLVKTAGDMERVVESNPFLKAPGLGADESKLHVTFLSGPVSNDAEDRLKPLVGTSEQFRAGAKEIYLYCPNGYGNTKMSNNAIEKVLGLQATTRNWRTVNALVTLAMA